MQRQCREYVTQQEAEAIAKYTVGHDMKDVARRINLSATTVQNRLDLAGMSAAIGGAI